MKKNTLLITIALLTILFTSCSQSFIKVENNVSAIHIPPTTNVPTKPPTVDPTATPFVPLTLEDIEEKLEAYTGEELIHSHAGFLEVDDLYVFLNDESRYMVDSTTGEIRNYYNYRIITNPEELFDEEGALDIAFAELNKLCPNFFDYEYFLETHSHHKGSYVFSFYQLSLKGYRTGNFLSSEVLCDGTIKSYSITNHNDPEEIDTEINLSRNEVLDIAFLTAKDKYEDCPDYNNINLDDRGNLTISAYIVSRENQYLWYIEVSDINTGITVKESGENLTTEFIIIINANTGEVIDFSKGYKL